ncbi:hypothetical protein N2152v2_004720 [Parachlorella kessleri]
MKNLFSKKPDVRETVKSSQRTIGRNVRDIERELLTLKREEQQLVKQIKDAANKNNVAGAKLLAKQLVRLRGQQTKLQMSIASLRGVSTSVVTAAATTTVGTSMAHATKAMQAVGTAANLPQMHKNMQQFAQENARMEMASEMMDDALESTLDGDEVEDETNELVDQVLAGIGIDVAGQMASAPKQRVAARQQQQQQANQAAPASEEDELIARLTQLK